MAISSVSLLIVLIALPFVGSCLAALLPANARNAEAYLAGVVSLICFDLGDCDLSSRRRWRRAPNTRRRGFRTRPRLQFEDGRLRLGVRRADHRHRLPGRAVRALLHVARRSSAALLLFPARVHGRDARHRALGQPDPAGLLLGTDQPLLLPADRLLAPDTRRRATARAWR